MPTVHADTEAFVKEAGTALNLMKEEGILTDTNVAASNTVASLKTAIETAVNSPLVHAEIRPQLAGFLRAIDALASAGVISDAILAPLTTVNALIALTGVGARKSAFIPS